MKTFLVMTLLLLPHRSASAEHGHHQAAIDLSPNCSAEYASRRRSG